MALSSKATVGLPSSHNQAISPARPAPISTTAYSTPAPAQQGQRHANLIIEIALGGQGLARLDSTACTIFFTVVLPLLPVMATSGPLYNCRL